MNLEEQIIDKISLTSKSYFNYMSSYELPREAVINYLMSENLIRELPDCNIETDKKMDMGIRKGFVDLVVTSKKDGTIVYLMNRQNMSIREKPKKLDLAKLELLTKDRPEVIGIIINFYPALGFDYNIVKGGVITSSNEVRI